MNMSNETLFDIPGSLADHISRAWTEADADCPDRTDIAVVLYGTERVMTCTESDLDHWDPFRATDGWPSPAVGAYSQIVSPFMRVSELWRHLGRVDALNTYTLGDAFSITTR